MKYTFIFNLYPILICFLVTSGCNGPMYTDGQRFMPGRITPQRKWVVSSTDLKNPSYAADGNIHTAAVSSASFGVAELTIDLGKQCVFNMVTVDHGSNNFGFVRRVELLTSREGITFQQQASNPDLRRVITFLLKKPVMGRYLKIRTVVGGTIPWTVAEIYLN